jgi:hypothetical protein
MSLGNRRIFGTMASLPWRQDSNLAGKEHGKIGILPPRTAKKPPRRQTMSAAVSSFPVKYGQA